MGIGASDPLGLRVMDEGGEGEVGMERREEEKQEKRHGLVDVVVENGMGRGRSVYCGKKRVRGQLCTVKSDGKGGRRSLILVSYMGFVEVAVCDLITSTCAHPS